jgi:copper(I)-binding protein
MNKENRWPSVSIPRLIIVGCVGALLLFGCAAERIQVQDAWARPASAGENSAIYFALRNNSPTDVELVEARSDLAEVTELHRSMMEEDVMKMVKQVSILIPAGEEMIFKPGDYHVMLMRLKRDLPIGDSIELTLFFDDATEIALQVPAKEQ